jgi:uncharacterized membrane protein required for colicin V production
MVLNWLAVVVLVYLALGALEGLRQGLVLVVCSLAGYVTGLLLAARYQAHVTSLLMASLPVKRWIVHFIPAAAGNPSAYGASLNLFHTILGLLVFLLIVGLTEAVARAVGQAITVGVARIPVVGALNRLGGVAGGLAENALVAGIILGLLTSLPFLSGTPLDRFIHHTPLAAALVRWVGRLANWRAERWLA